MVFGVIWIAKQVADTKYTQDVRPHECLEGQTPADKAGIKIGGTNKWITLIQNSRIKET
jgi:hypothetical protein